MHQFSSPIFALLADSEINENPVGPEFGQAKFLVIAYMKQQTFCS